MDDPPIGGQPGMDSEITLYEHIATHCSRSVAAGKCLSWPLQRAPTPWPKPWMGLSLLLIRHALLIARKDELDASVLLTSSGVIVARNWEALALTRRCDLGSRNAAL